MSASSQLKKTSIYKDFYPITDIKYLIEADKQLSNPRNYKFPHAKSVGALKLIPKVLIDWWFEHVVGSLKRADKSVKQEYKRMSYDFIRRKIFHTDYTVLAGHLLAEKIQPVTLKQSAILCLLHDIGRFEIITTGPLVINADHGYVSGEIIRRDMKRKEIVNVLEKIFNVDEMIEAVSVHSIATYEGKNVFARFLRDADKTSLIAEMRGLLKMLHYTIPPEIFWDVSKEVRRSYISEKKIYNESKKTGADMLIQYISFPFQFYFPETYNFAISHKLVHHLVGLYKKYVKNKDEELTREVLKSLTRGSEATNIDDPMEKE